MTYCAIKWCEKNSRTSSYKKDGLTFHRFPRCPNMKSKWIDATRRGDEWFPNQFNRICSRHFTEDCFHNMKNHRRLVDTAEPTLYLPLLVPNSSSSQDDTRIPSSSPSHDATLSSPNKSQTEPGLGTPTTKFHAVPNVPAAFHSMTRNGLYRRIMELKNTIQIKNKLIKKVRDSNRFMKKRINSLKSSLEQAENKLKINRKCSCTQ